MTAPASTPLPGSLDRAARPRPSRAELARAALWLGLTGFGGGLSVLAQIHQAVVVRHRWLTDREFANTATVAQMLPGGAAANALAYTGLRFFGTSGAVLAYGAFILPGAVLVTALAWGYVRFGAAAPALVVLDGMNAAIVGVVAAITLQMVRTGVSRAWQMGVAAGALLLAIGGGASAGEVAALGIGAGLVFDLGTKRARLLRMRRTPRRPSPPIALPDEGAPLDRVSAERAPPGLDEAELSGPAQPGAPTRLPAAFLGGGAAAPIAATALLGLALLFFRAGLGAYGGGFAIIPHLRETVLDHGWITSRQFADAVAIAKLTPGPVLLLATFVGFLVHGFSGALVATLATFAGPLLLVIGIGTWLVRVRSRRPVRAALRGLTPAVVGLMAAAAIALGGGLAGPPEIAIAAAATLTLVRFRVNPVLIMLLGGLARVLLRAAGI